MSRRRCCCSTPCNATVNIDLAPPCGSTHDDAWPITVKDHATGTTIATGTTNNAGVLSLILPATTSGPRVVDVYGTKTGCFPIEWLNRTIPCNGSITLTADAICGTVYQIIYSVIGCYSKGLPGVTVTATKSGTGETFSAVTDSGGNAIIAVGGPGTYTVTISAEGFNPFTSAPHTIATCGSVSSGVTLTVADTHVCCEVQKQGPTSSTWSPWPIKKVLTLTDDQGVTTIGACSGSACVVRSIADVSSQCGPISYDCGGGVTRLKAPTTATGSAAVWYAITLSTTPGSINFTQGWKYHVSNFALRDTCEGAEYYRTWRCESDCEDDPIVGPQPVTTTIHSLHPFLVEFNFNTTYVGTAPTLAGLVVGAPIGTVFVGE